MQRIGDYRIERELTASAYEGVHLVLPRRAAVEVARADNKVQLLRQACIRLEHRRPVDGWLCVWRAA